MRCSPQPIPTQAAGRLVVGPSGMLPGAGNVLNIGGVPVQLSGGRVIKRG